MEDLSLHVLDIAENSVDAGAKHVGILIRENPAGDMLTIEITDDGNGMDASAVAKAVDPFYTTRTTRRVGLGLPFLDEAARSANGRMQIRSTPGKGTTVRATFQLSHIDRKPLGRMTDTIITLIAGHPDLGLRYRHERNRVAVVFSTRNFRRQPGGPRLIAADNLRFIRRYLLQEEEKLYQETKRKHYDRTGS